MDEKERDEALKSAFIEYVEGLKAEGYSEAAAVEALKYEVARCWQSLNQGKERRRQAIKAVK